MSRGTERVGVRDSATMFVASFAAPCCCSRTKSDWTFWRRCPGSQLSPQHGVTSPRSPCKLQGCWLLDTKQAPEPCEHVGAVRDVDARCLQDSGVSGYLVPGMNIFAFSKTCMIRVEEREAAAVIQRRIGHQLIAISLRDPMP